MLSTTEDISYRCANASGVSRVAFVDDVCPRWRALGKSSPDALGFLNRDIRRDSRPRVIYDAFEPHFYCACAWKRTGPNGCCHDFPQAGPIRLSRVPFTTACWVSLYTLGFFLAPRRRQEVAPAESPYCASHGSCESCDIKALHCMGSHSMHAQCLPKIHGRNDKIFFISTAQSVFANAERATCITSRCICANSLSSMIGPWSIWYGLFSERNNKRYLSMLAATSMRARVHNSSIINTDF